MREKKKIKIYALQSRKQSSGNFPLVAKQLSQICGFILGSLTALYCFGFAVRIEMTRHSYLTFKCLLSQVI